MGPDGNITLLDEPDWSVRDTAVSVYVVLCFTLGLCGNVFLVVTSHLYQSIDLDRVTIVLVRQLAIADLMQVINTILPTLVTVFKRKWVLGETLCDITGHYNFIPVMVNIYLVLSVSVFKILACKLPFRMRDVTGKHAWGLVLLSYCLAGVEFLESVFLAKKGVYMAPVDRCLSTIYISHPTLMLWNAAIPVGVPILGIIVCNVWIYKIVRGVVQNKDNAASTRALITVCAISGLFIISWTPKLLYVAVVNITKQQIPWAVAFSHYLPFINSVGNPLIYTVTNKRYGEFVYGIFVEWKIRAKDRAEVLSSKIGPAPSRSLPPSKIEREPGESAHSHQELVEIDKEIDKETDLMV